MHWSCDRTGFPILALTGLGLEISLWPVTKFQFERFLAEPNDYEDAWYARVLQVSPRPAARALTAGQREACFMAGSCPRKQRSSVPGSGGSAALPCRRWPSGGAWNRRSPLCRSPVLTGSR